MNLSTKGFPYKDAQFSISNKVTTLNPNAAEFVPSALKSMFGNTKSVDPKRLDVAGPSGKTTLERSESTVSNNSDDEAHQYWRRQLPDDITPDFNVTTENESQTPEQLSPAGSSISDGIETSRFSTSSTSHLLGTQEDVYLRGFDNLSLTEKTEYSGPIFPEDQPSAAFMTLATNKWNKRFINGNDHFMYGREGRRSNVDSRAGFTNNLLRGHVLESAASNPLDFLASQFPGFAAENLAEVYYANCCDLNSTIKMLTQLELQVDVNVTRNQSLKALSAPSLSMMDFPALPVAETHNGEDFPQDINAYNYPSSQSRGTIDFASAVQKLVSQDSGHWYYENHHSADGNVGSSRISQPMTNSYNGHGKSILGDKLQNFGAARIAPAWPDIGEALGNTWGSKEEARDFAHLRNVCLEQARQAYMIGNKALAKELTMKGQFYGIQMKAAHGKARETIHRQRNSNPIAAEVEGYSRGQNPLIDLHGLHVSEAIHVLKHELSILRSTARSAGQRLQVMVCLGSGHQTKGGRTPTARLPVAVEQYLLEEGLPYTQPQPGLLRVVIY